MSINTKKWFGRIVMLALACFMFLGMKDRVAAKADDPEASARIIYANNLDNEGNPTGSTQYNFVKATGYLPYAVYVTTSAASGSAITLRSSDFIDDLKTDEFTNIRIWDNNCGIMVETANKGWLNEEGLILAGDASYLDIGWNHYNRGYCGANVNAGAYTSNDTASDIAAYFNGFVFHDNNPDNEYRNDVSVTLGYDSENIVTNTQDPHYGKTVYNISWVMQVTNLTLEPNVVAFIQDGGYIEVSGKLTVGSGSYLEGIDDNPKLRILEDGTVVEGMDLYDYYGASGEDHLTSNLSGEYRNTEVSINGVPTRIWTKLPNDFVDAAITTAAKKYIYAYANEDFDGDGAKNDDLSFALATELACKFVGSYGMFGLQGGYDWTPGKIWDNGALAADATALRSRIAIDYGNSTPITVKTVGQNGESTSTIQRYTATVTWGHTNTGQVVESTVYVYQLNKPEDLLICTDFNESTSTGTTWYVRDAFADKRVLVGDLSNPGIVDDDHYASVIVTDSFSNVAVGGHGVEFYKKNIDTNLFTFQTINFNMRFMENGQWTNLATGTSVKIFTTSGKYFATSSEGEAKRYDFVSHDATGNAADKIWEAGGQYPVKLFIHDNILHIKPLNANTGVSKALKEVRLTDSIPAAAVTIDSTDPTDIVITFNSNFYDTVHFELEYADGSVGAFTVEREGIIIQHTGVGDPAAGRYWLDIYGEGDGNEFNYTLLDDETYVAMATYYHSSAETGNDKLSLILTYDDGTTEIISSVDSSHNFSGYKSGITDDNRYVVDGRVAADTTSFIIAGSYTNGKFTRNGHTGGFSVQVVNEGYDSASSFGGAMAGSGKGKYWNGTVRTSN